MARIPNNELDRLKREVALLRLVESSGIELKKHSILRVLTRRPRQSEIVN